VAAALYLRHVASIAGRGACLLGQQPDGTADGVLEAQAADLADIARCLAGDGEAYRGIVERHQQRVGGLLWRFTRDAETREELAQETFVQVYLSLRSYRAEAPFEHWLSRIATRVGYRFWKRQARERAHPTVAIEDWDQIAADAPPDPVEPAEAGARLHTLLARLGPRDRLVLTLRYLEERSVEETARLTGWSPTMVKVQAWRAIRRLRKTLGTDKETPQ
jgi:RNA polymerase sigma-70 factor (ECF subfamily)